METFGKHKETRLDHSCDKKWTIPTAGDDYLEAQIETFPASEAIKIRLNRYSNVWYKTGKLTEETKDKAKCLVFQSEFSLQHMLDIYKFLPVIFQYALLDDPSKVVVDVPKEFDLAPIQKLKEQLLYYEKRNGQESRRLGFAMTESARLLNVNVNRLEYLYDEKLTKILKKEKEDYESRYW